MHIDPLVENEIYTRSDRKDVVWKHSCVFEQCAAEKKSNSLFFFNQVDNMIHLKRSSIF